MRLLILLLFIATTQASAQDPNMFAERIELHNNSIELSGRFNVLVWNLYMLKNISVEKLKEQSLYEKIEQSDILLFQEIIADRDHTQEKLDLKHFNFYQIPYLKKNKGQFIPDEIFNGFATISKAKTNYHEVIIGDAVDIADGTQSMAIISNYPIKEKDQNLLIIHIHNGVSIFRTMNLLKKLTPIIQSHKGPLLIAGDFNSFLFKSRLVKRWARNQRLYDTNVKTPFRFKFIKLGQLDHAFFRGLELERKAEVLDKTINLSDHKGYYLNFKILE